MLRTCANVAALCVAVCFSHSAVACQYPQPPSMRDEATTATAIFVFRLESAAIQKTLNEHGTYDEIIVGRIRVVRILKGSAASFTKIEYSSDACGGRRMDIGHYYLVFADDSGDTIYTRAGDRSFFDITRFYSPSSNGSPVFAEALKFADGKMLEEDFLGSHLLDSSRVFP